MGFVDHWPGCAKVCGSAVNFGVSVGRGVGEDGLHDVKEGVPLLSRAQVFESNNCGRTWFQTSSRRGVNWHVRVSVLWGMFHGELMVVKHQKKKKDTKKKEGGLTVKRPLWHSPHPRGCPTRCPSLQGRFNHFAFRITISRSAHSYEVVVPHRFVFHTYFYVWRPFEPLVGRRN